MPLLYLNWPQKPSPNLLNPNLSIAAKKKHDLQFIQKCLKFGNFVMTIHKILGKLMVRVKPPPTTYMALKVKYFGKIGLLEQHHLKKKGESTKKKDQLDSIEQLKKPMKEDNKYCKESAGQNKKETKKNHSHKSIPISSKKFNSPEISGENAAKSLEEISSYCKGFKKPTYKPQSLPHEQYRFVNKAMDDIWEKNCVGSIKETSPIEIWAKSKDIEEEEELYKNPQEAYSFNKKT